MKRLLLSLTLIAFGLSAWGQSPSFSAVAPTGQTLYYKISLGDMTVAVVYPDTPTNLDGWGSYAKPTGALTIPDTVTFDGTTYPVVAIAEGAFANCDSLTSVSIPNSVTSIGSSAFLCCYSLASVNIPDSVTRINAHAFRECRSLESIVIPDAVTYLGEVAFYGCRSLRSLTISNSVTALHSSVFGNCTSLPSVVIPNSVTEIYDAFSGCTSLTSVSIPSSVTSIAGSFHGCSSLPSVTLPNSVTYIGESTFAGCSSLASIVLPDSLTGIDWSAFRECSSLTHVSIPNTVNYIGASAFEGCSSLESINIPNLVTRINQATFSGCSSLTSITIPSSVTTIKSDAFANCRGLTEIVSHVYRYDNLGDSIFYAVPNDIPVYIPCGSLVNYQHASSWWSFTNFVEDYLFSLQVESSDEAKGRVEVVQEHSCEDLTAVVEAIPAEGYRFLRWSDDTGENPYSIQVTSDIELTAYFCRADTVGISSAKEASYEVAAEQGGFVVKGAAGERVRVLDVTGRVLYQGRIESEPWRFVPAQSGAYLVQIADAPAQRVVVKVL